MDALIGIGLGEQAELRGFGVEVDAVFARRQAGDQVFPVRARFVAPLGGSSNGGPEQRAFEHRFRAHRDPRDRHAVGGGGDRSADRGAGFQGRVHFGGHGFRHHGDRRRGFQFMRVEVVLPGVVGRPEVPGLDEVFARREAGDFVGAVAFGGERAASFDFGSAFGPGADPHAGDGAEAFERHRAGDAARFGRARGERQRQRQGQADATAK